MSFRRLEALGFTEADSCVYEVLIKDGESKIDELSRKTGLGGSRLDESLDRLVALGAIAIRNGTITTVPPKNFLQKYLQTREVDLEMQLADLRNNIAEIQAILEPIFSESRFGLRHEELWETVEGLTAMEILTIRMISRARSEVCILAERFSWYPKVREEIIAALDKKVRIKVILLTEDAETEERIADMKRYGIEVRVASCDWRSVRFTVVDRGELTFLIWAKKSGDGKVYYRPGYTTNLGLICVFTDSFNYLWDNAKAL